MTPRESLQKAAELGQTAMPGPWSLGTAGHSNVVYFDGDDIRGVCAAGRNATFISVCDPQSVQSWLALVEELERDIKRVVAEYERAELSAESQWLNKQEQLIAAERERDELAEQLKEARNLLIEKGYNQWAPLQVANEKLTRERGELAAALRAVQAHQETVAPSAYLLSTVWCIAASALATLDAKDKP